MLLGKLSNDNKKLFFELELALANTDGKFDFREEQLIRSHCAEMGIEYAPTSHVTDLNELVQTIRKGMTAMEKKIIFIELVAVALADGNYEEEEQKFIKELQVLFGIPETVATQATELIRGLIKQSGEIEDFVMW